MWIFVPMATAASSGGGAGVLVLLILSLPVLAENGCLPQFMLDNWNAVNHFTIQGLPLCALGLVALFLLYSIRPVRNIMVLRMLIKTAVVVLPFAYAYWLWVDGNCGSFSQLLSTHWGNNPQRQYESAGLFGYALIGWIVNLALLESIDG
jgi:hypothetical protein